MEITATSASSSGVITTGGSNIENTGVSTGSTGTYDSKGIAQNVRSASSDFAAFMTEALGGSGKKEVNEEELFAALIEQKLANLDPEAAKSGEASQGDPASIYRAAKARLAGTLAKSDGYVPWEDVAKSALQELVSTGVIDRTTADRINGEAFAAAQLDDNLTALYDGRGSANDPTIATAELETALRSMESILEKIANGEMTVEPRAITVASNSITESDSSRASSKPNTSINGSSNAPSGTQRMDGSGGFLWKPVSESNSKLVVLLPSSFAGNVDRVEIHRALPANEETKIETGRFSSVANGGRPHFRFDKAGADYPDGSYVVAYQDNGEISTWQISNTAARND